MEPKLTNTAHLKTYSRSKCWKVLNPKDTKSEPLTTKEAVKYLLQGSLKRRVCRFCLTTTTSLSELDEILDVASSGVIFQVTIRDMVASFYPYQVKDDPNFPNKICGKCLDRTINCYLFTQQCERAERALRNCFIDIDEKFDKLDPLERVKKRGRQKLNPNYNVLHVEHKKVINYAQPIINIVNIGSYLDSNNDGIEINEFECPKCWQVFTNVESLVNHEKVHPKSMWYNCKLCGNSFVKHSHYKRHMKQFHVKEKKSEVTTNKQNFQCKECGTETEELENYLQHIEKHKFKNVLEHLVEKKMDSLCGVCLDKGDSMVELNETVSLHGGYPELSGDMTMATVLTATIPEKSHKYEELLVSKEASCVKIAKKNPKASGRAITKQDVIKEAAVNTVPIAIVTMKLKSPNKFSFSNPIKISDNFDLIQEMEIGNLNIDQTDDCSTLKKETLNNGAQVKYVDSRVGLPFSFSNPLKISDDSCELKTIESKKDLTQPNDIGRQVECNEIKYCIKSGECTTPTLCSSCSMFKKAQCDKCIEKVSINNESTKAISVEIEVPQTKPCKMCWIFSKVDRCNYCKKAIDGNKTVENKVILGSNQAEVVLVNQNRDIESEREKNIVSERVILCQDRSSEPVREINIECERKKNIEIERVVSYQDRNSEPVRETNIECENVISNRKRKIESENVVPKRKRRIDPGLIQTSKWQCEICLTNNDNRERCFCCGERKVKDDSTNFNFSFSKYDYLPKYDMNTSEEVKNNNYITKDKNEVIVEKIEHVTTKKEDGEVEIVSEDLVLNKGEAETTNDNKEYTNQNRLQVEEEMDVNFDDNDVKLESNIVKFNDIVEKISPAMQMNVDEGTCTTSMPPIIQSFTPPIMQSSTPPIILSSTPSITQSFSPTFVISPPPLSFNIGSQDDSKKCRKILKNMRHRRERHARK